MLKLAFKRECPDCGRVFEVDNTYDDDAYALHAAGDPSAVCQPCFDAFDGMTMDELIGTPPTAPEKQ